MSMDRMKYLEYTILLDYEAFVKHVLVVEASDSSVDSPLQSIVTVEIGLSDLNDNRPLIMGLFSLECAAYGASQASQNNDFSTMSLLASLDNLMMSGMQQQFSSGGGHAAAVNTDNMKVSLQSSSSSHSFASVLNVNRQLRHSRTTGTSSSSLKKKKFYSSKIVLESLSEHAEAGKCLGQFQTIYDIIKRAENDSGHQRARGSGRKAEIMTPKAIKRLKRMFDHSDRISTRQAGRKFKCDHSHVVKTLAKNTEIKKYSKENISDRTKDQKPRIKTGINRIYRKFQNKSVIIVLLHFVALLNQRQRFLLLQQQKRDCGECKVSQKTQVRTESACLAGWI
ncbi:unnamed protein product [Sphagnum balticum]